MPFRSYLQPLVIMSAIPFGLVGAIVGHLVMGYTLSFVSVFGIIALSGVVVNDSLVLIDAANKRRAEGRISRRRHHLGGPAPHASILLTSLTTFFGLMPMIFETSVQARFLIPMAISLGFGVLFATVIVLLLVPSLPDHRGLPARASHAGTQAETHQRGCTAGCRQVGLYANAPSVDWGIFSGLWR